MNAIKKIAGYSPEEKSAFYKEEDDSFCRGRQIVLLPTGAGKSLCFQIPAILLDGPSLVIYPLLALMTDQQRRMEEGNLGCVVFRGGQTDEEREENFRRIKEGAKIILANPEVLGSDKLLERLCGVGIKHIAIDEAHCVSEWGDSFRPAYLELGKVIERLNPPVITAFTATASPQVLSRVAEILFKGEAHVVRSESDRPNIHYFVKKAAAKKKEALYLAATEKRPMIIFCGTRNKAEDMAKELNVCFGRGVAKFYHAGLLKEEKTEVETWFYNSRDGILCATCAYGMGVDKKDIKTVVHMEASETAEAYIQEAGRGGRDGSDAKAILLWSLSDSLRYSSFAEGSRQRAMKDFAETDDCRRQVLLDALGAEQAYCHGCDLCNLRKLSEKEQKKESRKNISDWEIAYNLIKHARNFYTQEEIESELVEKLNCDSVKKLGKRIWNHSDATEIISQLMESGKIKKGGILWKNRLRTASLTPQLPHLPRLQQELRA
ncbi:ATP-dependent DNA helicase, RecQ family [Treponema sp. JC4]|uniref:RecQ family ATP-dependent DNA helicase n=1 Tax=Treponema sp. JC4 TaxID=1124982 RepID=UPI00025AFDBE|nr:RecQ family ATP-dependent DNA helicase [Treponema sp. JC4]EID84312.1 ATP-dependent DNA helicase, RecQ family [Treponema sp. JC4]